MLGRMYVTMYFQTLLEGVCIYTLRPMNSICLGLLGLLLYLVVRIGLLNFPVLAVTVGSLSLYLRHQTVSVSEVRTVYQQRPCCDHFMGADSDKRIHKLPSRLKTIKTMGTVITKHASLLVMRVWVL